jgi:sugar phosphate isomerase/epimerase
MVLLTRRDAGKLLLAGCAGALVPAQGLLSVTKINSVVRGVQIGAQAYSFRDRPLDECIAAFREVGLGECELSEGHFQKENTHGSDLNQWRIDTPLSYFKQVRKKFDDAGVSLSAYGYNIHPDLTDAMIERGFQSTLAMGLNCITTTTKVSMVPRIDQFAEKYKIMVGYHNHDNTANPDEVATVESFARVLKGASPYARINLDIGHFTAANEDPVAFIREHHAKIVTLHLKDRKKDHGPNVPFGQGDTPIAEVLRLLRDNQWKIPANIEYEYGDFAPGLDTIAEVKKCYAYCRKALEG